MGIRQLEDAIADPPSGVSSFEGFSLVPAVEAMGLEEDSPLGRRIHHREPGVGKSMGESGSTGRSQHLAAQCDLQGIQGTPGSWLILEQKIQIGGRAGDGLPWVRTGDLPGVVPSGV
jgi:hypothetical protein